ncbi:MerR family transcriptional regulator [Actibacterium ureilyticum]|uniref:MerR family transcriptional regulator n=1 Tax=Actibacterium ureilyticum TaxID=1590614 RepID=UPI001FE70A02|nr:MerR family transcriptional regulator [Actibacterium ureilyticum]
MKKSPDAFRTISEVSEWLETPAHVLRFWESRFSQVKPVKRAGGRRYYRPSDMLLLGGIKRLLHEDGMTIRGAQKVLREQGVKHVSTLSQPLDADADMDLTASPAPQDFDPDPTPAVDEAPMAIDVPHPPLDADPDAGDNVVPLDPAAGQADLPFGQTDADDDGPAHAPPVNLDKAPQPDPAPEPPAEPTAADLPDPTPPAEQPTLDLHGADDTDPAQPDTPPAPAQPDDTAELRPLGAHLPKHDPRDDDDSLHGQMPPPLTIQLRDRVVRLKLSQEHRDELNAAMSRLNTLHDRMTDGG